MTKPANRVFLALKSFSSRKNLLFSVGLALLVTSLTAGVAGCSKSGTGGGINLYSVEDDKKLGEQVAAEVESDPNIKILDPSQYPAAYTHLNRIVQAILNSGEVKYKDEFAWRVRIIKDDTTLNAFAAPGGYIYVYTGIIKYLDKEDDFAGVMGHEIAHADERHVTANLTKQYGLQVLLDVALGENQNVVTDIAAQLTSLSFSRGAERDADSRSVAYLCPTTYKSNGAAGFFRKLISMQQSGNVPAFLSTHPSPDDRVEDIDAEAVEKGCDTTSRVAASQWAAFKASLP